MLRLLITLLIPLLLGAHCNQSWYAEDEEILGVGVDWGNQQDREALDEIIAMASQLMGDARLIGTVNIKFVDTYEDATRACWQSEKVAGCWDSNNDLIIAAKADTLVKTAVLHELFHRGSYVKWNDVDYNHCRRDWWDKLGQLGPTGFCKD